MSNLGGNSPSADTDKSNNLKGDPGKDGVVATVVGGTNATVDATDPANPIVNAEGQVESVVGGTNTTIDNTDPKNPIINVAASSSPTTTKGDVIARGASVDERVAVGTDGQVLVADAASASGVKWETPAAGGGGAADFMGLKPADGFYLAGEIAASSATHQDGSVLPEEVRFDFIYFSETTTTIDVIELASDTASNGGTVIVALHPVTARGVIGAQSFVGTITVGTSIDSTHSLTLGTPWVVPKGHYAIAIANATGVNVTNIIGATSGNTTGAGFGKFVTGKSLFIIGTNSEAENRCMRLYQDDYPASPDLSAIDFTDASLFKLAPSVNGELGFSIAIPIVIMRVASTT